MYLFLMHRLRLIVLIGPMLGLVACSTTPTVPDVPQGNWRAVNDVLRLQGQPYRNGGTAPGLGFDCSGLVQYVYAQQGIRLPRDTLTMAQELPSIAVEQRQPGDLLFFDIEGKPFSHVGVYLGEDAFIHAPRSGRQVVRASLTLPYWRKRLIGVRRPGGAK